MASNFTTQVDEFIMKSEKRLIALSREAIQRTIDIAQTPVAKGGKMRVDTGFLRASGQGSLTGVPTGPARPDPNATPGQYDDGSNPIVVVQLGQMQLGSIFYFAWTASYAKYREAYDGFLEGALQRWQQTVNEVTDEIKQRINSK